jgi:hypothetical protein
LEGGELLEAAVGQGDGVAHVGEAFLVPLAQGPVHLDVVGAHVEDDRDQLLLGDLAQDGGDGGVGLGAAELLDGVLVLDVVGGLEGGEVDVAAAHLGGELLAVGVVLGLGRAGLLGAIEVVERGHGARVDDLGDGLLHVEGDAQGGGRGPPALIRRGLLRLRRLRIGLLGLRRGHRRHLRGESGRGDSPRANGPHRPTHERG